MHTSHLHILMYTFVKVIPHVQSPCATIDYWLCASCDVYKNEQYSMKLCCAAAYIINVTHFLFDFILGLEYSNVQIVWPFPCWNNADHNYSLPLACRKPRTSPEIYIFSCFAASFKASTCNLSSSTCMDIPRNKSWTCKVSNQQNIFLKMADPILFMSPRLPPNCWCADPSFIQHRFPAAVRSPSDCFCLQQTLAEMGFNQKEC